MHNYNSFKAIGRKKYCSFPPSTFVLFKSSFQVSWEAFHSLMSQQCSVVSVGALWARLSPALLRWYKHSLIHSTNRYPCRRAPGPIPGTEEMAKDMVCSNTQVFNDIQRSEGEPHKIAEGRIVTLQFSTAHRWGGRAAWCCAGMCGAGSSCLDSEEQHHVGLGSAGTACGGNGRSASSCLSPRVTRPRQVLIGRKSTSWALSEAANGSRAHIPADPEPPTPPPGTRKSWICSSGRLPAHAIVLSTNCLLSQSRSYSSWWPLPFHKCSSRSLCCWVSAAEDT